MTPPRPLAVQLYTVREQLEQDFDATIARIAELGYVGVELGCAAGLPDDVRETMPAWMLDSAAVRRALDASGLVVCGTHGALPERHNAAEVLDEQERLGSDVIIVSALGALPGGADGDLGQPDTLQRTVERFDEAAALAAERGMRVGFHNHWWEWDGEVEGRTGWERFWERVDPSVVAELDIYWAAAAGQDPARLLGELGPRAQLVHVKDGPLAFGEPMTAIGAGALDVAATLTAGEHAAWHVVELDECATDIFDVLAASADWMVEHGFSHRR
jgi:sugar phosphate isomerase/epimerase